MPREIAGRSEKCLGFAVRLINVDRRRKAHDLLISSAAALKADLILVSEKRSGPVGVGVCTGTQEKMRPLTCLVVATQ